MMKLFISLCVASLFVLSGSYLFAGSVDHLSNFSAEYMRTLNRNAATDSADAVVYNPAGVMEMENGIYGNLSVQYTDKDWKNKVNGDSLSQDDPSIIPSLFGLYKKDRWAIFAAFTIPSGGGKVDFKDGDATTRVGGWGIINSINGLAGATLYDTIKNERLKAERYYCGFTLGGAYKINDMISVSLGTRYLDAYGKLKAKLQVQPSTLGVALGQVELAAASELERDADGWCGIIGLNVTPTEKLNIGLKYESRTRLKFKYDVKYDQITGLPSGLLEQQGITDGIKERRDLPAIFTLGVSYKFTPKIRVETDFTYYFQEDADWDGDEDNVDDGYELGIAFEYIFNKKLKASLGYLYSNTGMDARYMTSYKPELDTDSIGGGIAYEVVPGLILNFALENSFYRDASYVDTSSGTALDIEYEKNVFTVACGFQYKFK
jgi:long-chain fatty acid transport protein